MSKAFRVPVPVTTQTCCPSVTGDGDDIFAFLAIMSPSLRCFFHSTAPADRSIHHRYIASFSTRWRKMRLPQIAGVDPLNGGRGRRHAMFSVFDHLVGKF